MRRCKITGEPLPRNLYNHQRFKPNAYRYRRADGTFITLHGSCEQAVAYAVSKNSEREERIRKSRFTFSVWAEHYIRYVNENDHVRASQVTWHIQKKSIKEFCLHFKNLPTHDASAGKLVTWWDSLTHHQQHLRRPSLDRFFNFMAIRDIVKANPFSTRSTPRLMVKPKPPKSRLPLTASDYMRIRDQAPDWVQDSMDISLLTTMRISDVVTLKFCEISDGFLRHVVLKSLHQRGTAGAARLEWDLSRHKDLRDILNRRREAALQAHGCPFLIYAEPRQLRCNSREHPWQIDRNRLTKAFALARNEAGITPDESRTPPTFHEIRGLSMQKFREAGHSIESIAQLAAHTDKKVTESYMAEHVTWTPVSLIGRL